jgi:murein DD-endopeptidase MepM/ murein hydrolase activator NlpD
MGRLATGTPTPVSPGDSQLPSSTPTAPAPTATIAPTPTWTLVPTWTPTPLSPTPTVQLRGTVILDQDNATAYFFAAGSFIHPLRMVVKEDDIYLLDAGQLKLVSLSPEPSSQPISPPDNSVEGVVMHELADIALAGDKSSLLALDRAGNVFRYLLDDESWQLERLVTMPEASSRQDLISVCADDDAFYLLDTNVGQIWQHGDAQAEALPAEADLRESADFAAGEDIFVLVQEGYRGPLSLQKLSGSPLTPETSFVPPSDLREPSLLFLDQQPQGYLYVIDQGHQRLRLLDPESGDLVREYLFAEDGVEIRSVYAEGGKLYLAARDVIYVYPPEPVQLPTPEPAATPTVALASLPPHDPTVLELLPSLALPIEETVLSGMAFRLPGAPRSYRYGVHEGLDFYSAAGRPVTADTPVLAIADGEIIRVDGDYFAPSAEEMEEMLANAREVYHTPADTLDALRGRQVWIDHGEGIVTRYCHLSAVAEDLEVGQRVEQGQIIGYVGNSGTPASYYEQGAETHLHLEIRIGDGYLGQYLRPIEIKRWLNQVFGEGI